jgi:hypothetical protein
MLLEAAVPMVMAAGLAGISGTLLGLWLTAANDSTTSVSWATLALPVVAGIGLCLLMTLSAVPFVGRITDNEATRTE